MDGKTYHLPVTHLRLIQGRSTKTAGASPCGRISAGREIHLLAEVVVTITGLTSRRSSAC
jgi:hypothetical protein